MFCFLKNEQQVTMDEMQKLDGRLADQRQEKEELEDMLAAHQAEVCEILAKIIFNFNIDAF